jgi:hypothetical protein
MVASRYFVLAALLAGGSFAHAAPSHRKASVDAKAPSHASADADAGPDTDADTPRAPADAAAAATPEGVADSRQPTPPSGWTFAVGPYLWASSVEADVSFGPLTTGIDLGFVSLVRHTRYGIEAVLEARRGRFGISGDIMYGAAEFTGSTEIASVMTSITGKAGSLMVDSALSYEVIGGDAAPFSLEASSGVRYQRTTVQGEVGAAGFTLQTPEIVNDGADVVLGARATLRPTHWLALAGAFDVGVVGVSDSTWSTTLDASLRVSSRLLFTAGWRSLTMQRSNVNITMRGPRAALQFLF